jgi:putative ABC transport system ATP-binding protein
MTRKLGKQMTKPTLISASGLTRTFGSGDNAVIALNDVALEVVAGELVAIMGSSGSGKSTLLAALGGLDSVDGGLVEIEGRALSDLNAGESARLRRQSLGFVFQDLNLVASLTIRENVALPLELDGIPAKDVAVQVEAALEEMSISEIAHRHPDQVSGGQRQKAAVARSFIGERKILLADEPTGALDSRNSEEVIRLIRSKVDQGLAGVLVTHDAKIAAWADRILIMRDGSIIEEINSKSATGAN